jgi:hypothetical protein
VTVGLSIAVAPPFGWRCPMSQTLGASSNRIAHYALSATALAKARPISAEHVQSALEEVQ